MNFTRGIISIKKFFMRVKSTLMEHCSIVRCKNKQTNNSQVTYFSLPKDPQRQKSCLAASSRDKSNSPSNGFVCSDRFEDK